MLNFTDLLICFLNVLTKKPTNYTVSYLCFYHTFHCTKTSQNLLKEQAEFTNKKFTSLCPYGSDDPMGCEMKSYLGRCRGWRNVPLMRFSRFSLLLLVTYW